MKIFLLLLLIFIAPEIVLLKKCYDVVGQYAILTKDRFHNSIKVYKIYRDFN